jgi:hypothetical protein
MAGIYSPTIPFCLNVFSINVYRNSNVWDRVQEKTNVAPVAVCRYISNSDQQLCMKLKEQF